MRKGEEERAKMRHDFSKAFMQTCDEHCVRLIHRMFGFSLWCIKHIFSRCLNVIECRCDAMPFSFSVFLEADLNVF